MIPSIDQIVDQFDPRFKVFHELMPCKVRNILLVSSPYDAWIMEEDCRLSEAINNEYRGLNLSRPPRLHWASSAKEAVLRLEEKPFDLVIIMGGAKDRKTVGIANKIKEKKGEIPVILLCHRIPEADGPMGAGPEESPFDHIYIWGGNTDLLMAMIKGVEDRMNVDRDTSAAGIRVIIFVEDSPEYVSALLPILYRELVSQTQELFDEGLNEEHRLLAMRARPKILTAGTHDQALALFEKYEPYVLGVISDVRYPRGGVLDGNAGIDLLTRIKERRFDIPLLLISNESHNAKKAVTIPALFIDKNSQALLQDVRAFVLDYLGFGPFVFRTPGGKPVDSAENLRMLEAKLHTISEESLVHHCNRNDFSRWLFARCEIELASRVRPVRGSDFESVDGHREFLIAIINRRRMRRQKGVVGNFDRRAFDVEAEFLKIGKGSLGGKGRGLAFMASWLYQHPTLREKFPMVDISIPQTVVITTEAFDAFIEKNNLGYLAKEDLPDEAVAEKFLSGKFPSKVRKELAAYLSCADYPIAVRSSSLLEDAQFRAYAGLYKTYILANDNIDFHCRLEQFLMAVRMVYASTWFQGPKAFSKRVGTRMGEEKMAVIIQRLSGSAHGEYFYPTISGVAQSHNYYPFSRMTPSDGIATIAMGLGKAVMEGERNLRFSPAYPQILPQRSTVRDILDNSQRHFYALRLGAPECRLWIDDGITLVRREVEDAEEEYPVKALASNYDPMEDRIRDSTAGPGYPVMTFAPVLKYGLFPLSEILAELLKVGRKGMGRPVEIEFSVDLDPGRKKKPSFSILQIRPMSAREEMLEVKISEEQRAGAFCVSCQALGNTVNRDMCDIVYVKPDVFDPARTKDIAMEIGKINAELEKTGRKYSLVGPGRWGSSDHWLGIPVSWADISGVGAIIETEHELINAEPSQGSHFFHNITSLGINYLNVRGGNDDHIDWDWITSLPVENETSFVAHAAMEAPMILRVDGRKTSGVILKS